MVANVPTLAIQIALPGLPAIASIIAPLTYVKVKCVKPIPIAQVFWTPNAKNTCRVEIATESGVRKINLMVAIAIATVTVCVPRREGLIVLPTAQGRIGEYLDPFWFCIQGEDWIWFRRAFAFFRGPLVG